MEYKGIHYRVAQTIVPRGWNWTVFLKDGRIRAGRSAARPDAVSDAERAIDTATKPAPKRPES